MPEASLVSLLHERAVLEPNETAFTYIDYEQDWAGIVENLNWSQVYRRTTNVAHEARLHRSSVGDRALITAPQGLDYIAAFLGSIHAGFIAVPLLVPQAGAHDDRVSAVVADTSPSIILTTSAEAGTVAEYVPPQADDGATIIEVDTLDLVSGDEMRDRDSDAQNIAYLQYTSGSTRTPTGVMISHRNLVMNFRQLMSDFFPDLGGVAPTDSTIVSWLPFYHDMGLVLGVIAPILGGYRCEFTSPTAFLQRPARWIRSLAINSHTWSAAPNFAFELAVRKTSDKDMAGLDLGGVLGIISGSERIHPATLDRFVNRFAPYNLPEHAIRPSYGLAEATVYVASRNSVGAPKAGYFDPVQLAAGRAQRCAPQTGTPLISYGMPRSPMVRIVDPDTHTERPAGTVGEIWVHGENVAGGYWHKPEETKRTFEAVLVNPVSGTPAGPWLRTGDLGFVSEGEIFIVSRMKDLLIVYGRNHYPDDIEATVQEITHGRVAAISVPVDDVDKLVTIIELKPRGGSRQDELHRYSVVENDVTAALSKSHGLTISDLVLVAPGSIPTTTSGKIKRAACVERYLRRHFTRLDG